MSRKLALIIGNSEYEDGNLSQLVTPNADVNALAEVLRTPEIGGFDEVEALVNQPGTTVRRAIASFFAGKGRDDLLLLYFSGHGIRDDRGQLFLALKDSEHDLLRGTAIPAAYITEEMDNSRSRRQVLILDCCHSGAFSQGMKGAPGASVGTASAFEGTGSGRVVLTATDSTQYAWEGNKVIGQAANSVFTHYLIEGLRSGEADTDADGQITLDELYNYVYEQVVDETPMQTPGKWSYGQRGEMIIARNPHPLVKPIELPPDLQQTIDDPRPWVREGAVRELDRLARGNQPGLALAAHEALKRLASDDSRRVASLATESLAASGEMQRPPEMPQGSGNEARSSPNAHEEQQRPSPAPAEAEQRSNENALRDRPSHTETETGQSSIQNPTPLAERPGLASFIRTVVPAGMAGALGLTVFGWAIVWACGWVVGAASGWSGDVYNTAWVIIAVVGGLITGLALQGVEPSVRWQHVLMIAIGWAISVIISGSISQALYSTDSVTMNGTIRGAIGGLITGLILQRTAFSVHGKQILVITIGWTVGWTIGQALAPSLYDAFNGNTGDAIGLWLIPGGIMGALAAAVGGAVMFWQLGRAQQHS